MSAAEDFCWPDHDDTWPAPPAHRLDLNALLPGQMVFTRGKNEFGDGRFSGMVVRYDDDATTGERYVQVVTKSLTKPPAGRVYFAPARGRSYIDMGFVARMHRLAVADIDPAASDGFRHVASVWGMALDALRASTVAPAKHLGSALHDDLLTAYRTLRAEAEMLSRGAA